MRRKKLQKKSFGTDRVKKDVATLGLVQWLGGGGRGGKRV
jgi:hypothetical protein